jgi:hypothetical protein
VGIPSELWEVAIIEVSSSDPAIPIRNVTGTIHARLNKSLTVITSEEVVASAAVKVHCKNLLTLGEVLRCVQEPDTTWTLYVTIKRTMLIV